MPNETPKDNDDGVTLPHVPQTGSHNARPGSNGFSARRDPNDSSSSSPPDDEDDSTSDGGTDIRSKVHVRILPPVSVAALPDFPVRPAYDGEPTEVEKIEGEKRLGLVIGILAEADLKRLQELIECPSRDGGKLVSAPSKISYNGANELGLSQ